MSRVNTIASQPTGSGSFFETWLADRPKWLQTAAARLLTQQRVPDAPTIQELADLCTNEALKITSVQFKQVPAGAFAQNPAMTPVKIDSLNNVNGVNAIRPSSSLVLGKGNLTVIYGCTQKTL